MPAMVKKAGEEKILTLSLLVSGAIYLLFSFFENAWVLALISFLLGLGLGCGQPLSMILTHAYSPDGRVGEAMGLRITANKIIQVAVPLVFGFMGGALGLFAVFWSNAVLLAAGGYLNEKGGGATPAQKNP